jgi:hypothetical protein
MKKIFVFSMACIFAGSVFAQTQTEEKQPQEGTPSTAIADIRLANDLAKYGYAHNEALPLIQAAEILLGTPTQELKATKSEPSEKPAKVTEKTTGIPHTPEVLLADAKELAAGNDALLVLVKNAESKLGQNSRGRVYGPARVVRRVYANSSYTDYILFQAGEVAEVFVSGDGDTDLDLYIYDENGNFIAKDDDYSDDCFVRFFPKWTGSFKIKVVNRGRVYNDYILLSN